MPPPLDFSKHLPLADPATMAYAARAIEISSADMVTRATEWVAREYEAIGDMITSVQLRDLTPEQLAAVERLKAVLRNGLLKRSAEIQAMADRDRMMRG